MHKTLRQDLRFLLGLLLLVGGGFGAAHAGARLAPLSVQVPVVIVACAVALGGFLLLLGLVERAPRTAGPAPASRVRMPAASLPSLPPLPPLPKLPKFPYAGAGGDLCGTYPKLADAGSRLADVLVGAAAVAMVRRANSAAGKEDRPPTQPAPPNDTVPVDLDALERNITRPPDPLNDSIVNTLSTEVENDPVDPDEVRESVRAASEKAGWKRCRQCDQPVHDDELLMDDSGQQPIYLHRKCVELFSARVQRISAPRDPLSVPPPGAAQTFAHSQVGVQLHRMEPDVLTFPFWFMAEPDKDPLYLGWGLLEQTPGGLAPAEAYWDQPRALQTSSLDSLLVTDLYLSVNPPAQDADLRAWERACLALIEAQVRISVSAFDTRLPIYKRLRFRCREFPGAPAIDPAGITPIPVPAASSFPILFDLPRHRRVTEHPLPGVGTWGTGNLTLIVERRTLLPWMGMPTQPGGAEPAAADGSILALAPSSLRAMFGEHPHFKTRPRAEW